MLAEIVKTNSLEHLGIGITLQHLNATLDKVSFIGKVTADLNLSASEFSLELSSGDSAWSFCGYVRDNHLVIQGEVPTKALSPRLLFTLIFNNIKCMWFEMRLDLSHLDRVAQWSSYFSGYENFFPDLNPGRLAKQILNSAEIIHASAPSGKFSEFCQHVRSIDFVISLARLRKDSRFPAIIAKEDGEVIASRLVSAWNVLMIQDSGQRLFVFQGVTSCDAVFIPGLNQLIIICHISPQQILLCLRELACLPDFFKLNKSSSFIGYLVGHSRPYHCNYDSLLALQHLREEGEFLPEDALFSKSDEAFIDLSGGMGLTQVHQILNKDALNKMTEAQHGYLLKVGSWFYADQNPDKRSYLHAKNVDESLREFAMHNSNIFTSGALDFIEECYPLLWVGITGQKRCWLEQVEGTAEILNTLYEYYPKLGVVFDGWTPPLTSSDYHRKEARKDNEVIQQIIQKLHFRKDGRFGVVAGLPLLEKIRVGMSVDLFLANYTTGSINVARICKKPGVGHMSSKMAHHRSQHIHYATREIDPRFVKDQADADTLPGYVDYSIPWQAIYNQLIEILVDLNIKPLKPLVCQSPVDF